MHSRSLYRVLATARSVGSPALMVDVKCRSPSDGELIPPDRLESYVRAVVAGGADALSTPTDPVYFGGSIDTAEKIRTLSPVPLMRKEFFDSVEQMDESLDAGFDAVQLALSSFLDPRLFAAMKARAEQIGLEVVMAVHTAEQLEQAVRLGATAISINCRGVAALRLEGRSASYGQALASMAPPDLLVLLDGSYSSRRDIESAARAGADGVLLGTTIAKSSDPAGMLQSLRVPATWQASA